METTIIPEQFYYDLQNSRFREHAFREWEDYRNKVTDLIISSCDEGKTLAIFGAGRCCDVDLKRLAAHFSQVSLIDLNREALIDALRQYGLAGHPGVKLEIKDFVGITDEDYIRYVSAMKSREACGTIKQLDYMYEKARKHVLNFGVKCYDYSLVLNVHSQLNDTADWIRTQMMTLMPEPFDFDKQLAERINRETEGIIKKFNDAVFSATRQRAFIGYETGIQGRNTLGVQGAMQTYGDLRERERLGRIKSIRQNRLVWPYDKTQQILFSILLETLILL